MANQGFILGSVILMIANAISKILGAIFKIPLTYLLKEEGMAIFNTAFSVYSIFLNFVIAGFPLAITNTISKYYATKNYSRIKTVSKVSSSLLAVFGLLVSMILFFGAHFFAYTMKDPDAALAIKIISPSVFLVALSTVYKGFFQGSVNMIPTAISQVTESLIRLLVGFICAYLLLPKGIKTSSAGALFGITFGELVATSMLFLMYHYSKKKLPNIGNSYTKKSAAKELFQIAIPMFLCTCILSGLSMIDTSVMRNTLLHIKFTPDSADVFLNQYSQYTNLFSDIKNTLKMNIAGARWLYGAYSGYAMTVFNLPAGIIGSMTGVILPVITGHLAKKNKAGIAKISCTALLLTMIISIPFSACMFFFSKDILRLLFNNTASSGLLSALAPCLLFVAFSQFLSTLLHAAGKILAPALSAGIGILVKIVLCCLLIPNPRINIYGAPISSCAAYIVISIINTILVCRYLPFNPKIKHTVIKPFVCTVFMIVFMLFVISPLKFYCKENLGFILTCICGGLIYLLFLYLLNALPTKKSRLLDIE